MINGVPLTVVGIADARFHGTIVSYEVEVFIPVMTAPELGFTFGSRHTTPAAILGDTSAGIFYPQGYLRPGTTIATAAAEGEAVWATLSRDRPVGETAQRLRVVPFSQFPGSGQTYILPTLIVMSAMGMLVLLIACANIAGLVLVRGLSRRGEIAVRLALGATRARIVRLLVLENLVLAVPGAVLGVVLSWQGIPPLVNYAEWLAAPQRLFFNIEVDGLVIAFTVVVACVSAVVFGLAPALQSTRVDLVSVINEDASPRGAARGRLRAALVVVQVAVSLLLLVGAGLTMRSVEAAKRADAGFDPTQVTAIDLNVRQNGYDATRGRTFYRQLLETARTDAGVESATLALYHPLALLDTRSARVAIDGYEPGRDEDLAFMSNVVGPDYFLTLRIPLTAGREFEDRDDDTGGAGGGGEQHLGRAVLGRRGQRPRQAHPPRRRRLAHRGRRGRRRQVLADQRGAPAVRLPAVLPGVPVGHDAAHPRARARRGAGRQGARPGRGTGRRHADYARPTRSPTTSGARGSSTSSGRRCCWSSAPLAWRWRAWAPTAWCHTP